MKKAVISLLLLIVSASLFAKGPRRDFEKMDPEEVFKTVSERKYQKLEDSLRLTDKEKAVLIPILKKFDQEMFAMHKPNMEKMKARMEERKKERDETRNENAPKDYSKKLKRMEEGMKFRAELAQKMYDIQSKKIKALKDAKIEDELIFKTLKFERKFQRRLMGKMRGHRRGDRFGRGKGDGEGRRDGRRNGHRRGYGKDID